MTVLELRKLLRRIPGHLPVIVNGYEGGITEDIKVKVISVNRYVHDDDSPWYGEHEQDEEPVSPHDQALYIERGS